VLTPTGPPSSTSTRVARPCTIHFLARIRAADSAWMYLPIRAHKPTSQPSAKEDRGYLLEGFPISVDKPTSQPLTKEVCGIYWRGFQLVLTSPRPSRRQKVRGIHSRVSSKLGSLRGGKVSESCLGIFRPRWQG
jgi:hypothetical protein